MYALCLQLGIPGQHYALIIIPLFTTQAPTCFGTYVPSSGSVVYTCELLESPKWLCHRAVPLLVAYVHRMVWFRELACPAERCLRCKILRL
jgi:hypothetical protein